MKTPLPIDALLPQVRETLLAHSSLVLTAAPGAGKTTRLPPEILKITDKAVWVLEPRRIAAISASQRIAEENGWRLGAEVGYQVRFDNKSSPQTRLLFLTEALLMRKLLQDPELKNVGCVVLDEFHERSLHVDLALGALKELQELARPDLKIVVMSATLDAAPLARFLGDAPVIDAPGKIFPLEVRYEEKPQLLRTGFEFTERMQRLVQKAAAEREGDILCFLPGRGEIERLREALSVWADAKGLVLAPLHGQLDLKEQALAILPLPGKRKIILATNVAESSLTVQGVRVVVDGGLARLAQIHPRTGFESLDLVRISKASATQRAGRAARLGPGSVYRAWTPHDERSMKEFEPAEIQRTDLAESLLLLAALGVSRPETFSWFEAPPERALLAAQNFLRAIEAVDADGRLTPTGEKIQRLPVHPRLAKLLLAGQALGLPSFTSEIAALLSEPAGQRSAPDSGAENDLWVRWESWKRNPRGSSVGRAADQLKQLLGPAGGKESKLEDALPALLLAAYGDRLARRRRAHEPQAKMAGGRGVKLHPNSSVKSSEYFLALELAEGRDASETLVFQAAGLPDPLVESRLGPLATEAKRLEWDDEKKRFYAVLSREWNGVTVGKEHRRPAEPGEIEGRLAEVALQRWDLLLQRNEKLGDWLARLAFLHKTNDRWPLLADEQKREALDSACYGETSLEAVAEKDLVFFFENLLAEEHRHALASQCPASWTVPTGNRMRIRYSDEQGPQTEVRLQELFGLASAPIVAGQSLTLILLAPNYRPVQVTRDLASFWKNAYPEVRKEMRARYPKHSWPDDPLTAVPQAKGRPRAEHTAP